MSKLRTALTLIERVMAEHHEWLASVFSDNTCAGNFFADMARADREHERLVDLGFRLAGERLDLAVCVDVLDLRDTFAEVSRFRSSTPQPTLKDALGFSRDLEDHAAEEHLGAALASVDPSLSDLIQQLASDGGGGQPGFHRGGIETRDDGVTSLLMQGKARAPPW